MKKPDISIIGTAARPENWLSLYRSLGSDDVSFEIVFVGPNEPDYELPSNFRFIKSNVKPMQCEQSIGGLLPRMRDVAPLMGGSLTSPPATSHGPSPHLRPFLRPRAPGDRSGRRRLPWRTAPRRFPTQQSPRPRARIFDLPR